MELHRRGVLYAPDYIINSGGVINIACELGVPYNEDRAREMTERVYGTMERVLDISARKGVPTAQAAHQMARGAHRLGGEAAKDLPGPVELPAW